MTDDPLGALLSHPAPALTEAESLNLLRRHWGFGGELLRLTSERDLNWRVTAPAGRFVLKFTNQAEDPAITDFQTRALLHIAARAPDLPVPRVVPSLEGLAEVVLPSGGRMRLLSWVEGLPLHEAPPGPALWQGLGTMSARLTRALEGYAHPAADHVLQWDVKQAAGLRPLLPDVTDPELRARCAGWLDWFDANRARLDAVPWQVVHADLNPYNVLVSPNDPAQVSGVLDFGDMVRTPRICDLAVAAAYHVRPGIGSGPEVLAAMRAGWQSVMPLLAEEAALLPGLTALRMVTTMAIASHRAARWPDNAPYILRNLPSARAGLLSFPAPHEV